MRTRTNTRHATRLAAVLLSASLAIAACGGDDDDGGSADTATSADTADMASSADTATSADTADMASSADTATAASSADAGTADASGDMAADGEPIKVGVLTVSTGSLASIGEEVENGIDLSVEAINAAGGVGGRPIEVVKEEAGESPETAVAALQKLLTQDVAAITGMQFTGYVIPESPVLDAAGVPGLHAAQGPSVVPGENGTEWAFRVVSDDSVAARVLVPYAIESTGATKVAILHTSIDYGINFRDGIEGVLADQYPDVEIVTVQQHDGGDADFTPQLKAIESSGAEVVFSGQYPADVAKIANQRRERDIQIPFFWNNAADTAIGFGLMTPDDIQGDFVANDVIPQWSDEETVAAFTDAYEAAYDATPGFVGASWYSGILMLADAMERAGDPGDHDALRTALSETADFDTYHDLPTAGFTYTCDDSNNCHNQSRLYHLTADGPELVDTYGS